ncbi:hypothetical protein ACHQM5_006163 [Ranunculus cassubicifolius]
MDRATRNTHRFILLALSISTWCLLSTMLLLLLLLLRMQWINHGGDLFNRRYAEDEVKISPTTVSKMKLKWEFFAGKDITATPAIFDGIVYFPSWNGYLYAVNATSGSLVWGKNLTELTGLQGTGLVVGVNNTVSRATPTVAGDLLLIGIYGPAIVIAVKRSTGEMVWSTRLDSRNSSTITMSGTFYKGYFYVGVSSLEELLPDELCCTFRGSMAKLEVCTGAIVWQTYTLPDNFGQRGEYAGAAIWGSSPSIDKKRNQVYVSTGNLYSAPQRIVDCLTKENNQTGPPHPDECVESENHENSILAFDLNSGNMTWYKQLGGYDVWVISCLSIPDCLPGPNPDADFGESPMMLTIDVNGTKKDVAVAVQKSGFAWALDRDNGNIVWSSVAGPGGFVGGGTWGAATDKTRVYTNIVNNQLVNTTLVPSNQTTVAGQWVAMEASTGKVLWSIANPKNTSSGGPVTVANGVLFAGADDPKGAIYAMDAKNGNILWSYETGATVHGGMSVSNGCIYVGNGYTVNIGSFFPINTPGTSLFAFCIS